MDEIEIRAQLSAIEWAIMDTRRLTYKSLGISLEDAKEIHGRQIEFLRAQSLVRSDDPALSDHWSDVVLGHIARLLAACRTEFFAVVL